MEFVNLHMHTEYTLLGSTIKIDEHFVNAVKRHGYNSIAITDFENVSGWIEFYEVCMKGGIKPVLGVEVNFMNLGDVILIAESNKGFKNIIKMINRSVINNSRLDLDTIQKFYEGVIFLTGCYRNGFLMNLIRKKQFAKIEEILKKLKDIFATNLYIQIELDEDDENIKKLVEFAKKFGISEVASDEILYIDETDHLSYRVLRCIDEGSKLDEAPQIKNSYFLKPEKYMVQKFSSFPEAVKNSVKIAEKTLVHPEKGLYLPEFSVTNPLQLLKSLAYDGLRKRLGELKPEYKSRVDREIEVISKMGFEKYFLIVHDIVSFAKKSGFFVGPGRGSAAGSLVAYALDITTVDPIKHGLIFERFLNPGRVELPDIDIDFSDDERDRVVEYLKSRYSLAGVVRIITFHTILARGAIKDVARVLGIPADEANELSMKIPNEPGLMLSTALKEYPHIRDSFDKPQYRQVLDIAIKIDGLKRHRGVHAAGIIILPSEHSMPLTRAKDLDEIITQWNDKTALKLGYLKMDLLGLRTLKVIRDTSDWIRKISNPEFDVKKIPFDDKKTFEFLASASLTGIFQMESKGISELMRKVKPSTIDEIAHVIALYRPGIIEAGMLGAYIERRHNGSGSYIIPELKEILAETYGVVVFQEQAMRIAEKIAGFSPQEADEFRKVIAKKIPEEMSYWKERFISGAENQGYKKNIAAEIFASMEKFGEYVFNKSHATAYAYLTYITGYLKANHTLEFFVSLLSSEIGRSQLGSREKEPKIVLFLNDARNSGIKILKPDINLSEEKFKPERDGDRWAVRYGLLAVKNVGYAAVSSIIEERIKNGDFKSFENFVLRMKNYRSCTKKVIESLIKAGAFDSLYEEEFYRVRAKLLKKFMEDKIHDELFDSSSTIDVHINAILQAELEVLGDYISGHPLARFKKDVQGLPLVSLNEVDGMKGNILFGGMIRKLKKIKNFYVFEVEDFTSRRSVLFFPKKNNVDEGKLKSSNFIVAKGTVSNKNPEELIADEVFTIDEAKRVFKKALVIELNHSVDLSKIRKIMDENPGDCRVYIKTEGKKILIDKRISIDDTLIKNIGAIAGHNSVKVIFEKSNT